MEKKDEMKITSLLAEYTALREEIRDRINDDNKLLLAAGALLALAGALKVNSVFFWFIVLLAIPTMLAFHLKSIRSVKIKTAYLKYIEDTINSTLGTVKLVYEQYNKECLEGFHLTHVIWIVLGIDIILLLGYAFLYVREVVVGRCEANFVKYYIAPYLLYSLLVVCGLCILLLLFFWLVDYRSFKNKRPGSY
jgi:hypothetical protein